MGTRISERCTVRCFHEYRSRSIRPDYVPIMWSRLQDRDDMNDLQWVLAAQCRRMGLEVGEQPIDPAKPLRIHCPLYTEFEDEARQMHTEDTVEYLKRILYREYVFPRSRKCSQDSRICRDIEVAQAGSLSISMSASLPVPCCLRVRSTGPKKPPT